MTKNEEEQAEQEAKDADAPEAAPQTAEPVIPGTTAGIVDPNATAGAVEVAISKASAEAENPENENEPLEGGAVPVALPKAKKGHLFLRYVGHAEVIDAGEHKFRRGEWVEVRKGVAEELLTFPFERFEAMEAEGDDG